MRVLYVIAMYGPRYLGNLIHRELGHEFQARGHSFEVFALAHVNELPNGEQDSIEDGIAVHRSIAAGRTLPDMLNASAKPLFHYDRFGAGLAALTGFLRSRSQYDVVLAEGAYPFGAMTALAGAVVRVPLRLVITAAGGDFIASRETRYGYGRFRTARALMRYALTRAAAVRVTTPLVRERVIALGAPPDRIAQIPRNIASYCYPPEEMPLGEYRRHARTRVLTRHALEDAPLIAAVGRLLPIKGFDQLVRALPAIRARNPNAQLVLIGPNRNDPRFGDYQTYLEQLAVQCGVRDAVTFTGAIAHPEMRDYLAAADLIAVPSVLEGMNKVAVEGAAVGTPSVVTQTAGVGDLIQAAGCGVVVTDNAPEALADAVASLLADRQRRTELAQKGLVFAKSFSSAHVGAQLIELCERVSAAA